MHKINSQPETCARHWRDRKFVPVKDESGAVTLKCLPAVFDYTQPDGYERRASRHREQILAAVEKLGTWLCDLVRPGVRKS